MLELYVIRHGLAGKCLEDGAQDEKRPLKKKGKEILKNVAKGLKDRGICFDVVLTSPLLRAKESAEIVNGICSGAAEVTVTDLLRPDASYDALINYLNKLKNVQKAAIVGHEPFLSGFASYCLAKDTRSFLNLKKGGILMLEIDKRIKPGQCLLSWLMEPDHLISKRHE